MKYIILLILLIPFLNLSISAQPNEIEVFKHVLVDSGTTLGKVVLHDIDEDGYTDLIFQQTHFTPIYADRSILIKYVPGSEEGLNFQGIDTLISDKDIITFFVNDWNGDGQKDLIARKVRDLGDGSATTDVIKIWHLNKTDTLDSFSFRVPPQIYLGNEGNPKELVDLIDMNLDGKKDMVLIGFSHVTIGWNIDGGEPVFDEITNYGFNTYSTKVIDFNQDGYPDFINDDQYWKEPVVHLNKKNKKFVRTSVGLPKWSFTNESSLYWGFKTLWLDDDPFPDLLVRKASLELENANYKLYSFDNQTKKFIPTALQLNDSDLGELIPIHYNNDGFTDIAEIKKNKFRIWINDQNNNFNLFELDIKTSWALENYFHLDIDNDNDRDLFFSFTQTDTLYQIVNNEEITNFPPTAPIIDTLQVNANSVNINWTESTDEESLNGHINYIINFESSERSILLQTHLNQITLDDFQSGEYTVEINSIDPLGFAAQETKVVSFVVAPVPNEEEKQEFPSSIKLHQNYPNPFNPSTTISFELDQSAEIKLTVFDALGRTISVLVDEQKTTGFHEVNFDASNLSSGIYFYRLESNGFTETKRFTLIK